MDIICSKCSSKFRIPDDKIPAGRVTTLPCPKCKTRISLDPAKKTAAATENGASYDSADKPFDFIEEEGLTALLCEQNPIARKTIESALSLMDYQITIAESARDALKRMRYTAGFMHQKVFLIDSSCAAVGTANLDNRSFRLNFEVTLLNYDADFIKDVETMLENDFAHSSPVAMDEYSNRSFFFKLAVRSARLLAPIL